MYICVCVYVYVLCICVRQRLSLPAGTGPGPNHQRHAVRCMQHSKAKPWFRNFGSRAGWNCMMEVVVRSQGS